MTISERQKKIMIAIIQEFMKSAEAIGSQELKDIYNFDFSPATIRNELADLDREGLLYKEHTSSGRIPTTLAWRYYISEILNEDELEPVDDIKIRETIFNNRFNIENLINDAVMFLERLTNLTCFAVYESSTGKSSSIQTKFSGLSRLLDQKEFRDISVLKNTLVVLEDSPTLLRILKKTKSMEDISILIGEELGVNFLLHSAIVYHKIQISSDLTIWFGVIGSSRMNYPRIIPVVKNLAKNLKEATAGW